MKDAFTPYPYSPSPTLFAAQSSASSPSNTALSSGYELELLESDWKRFEENKLRMPQHSVSSTFTSGELSPSYFSASEHSDVKQFSFSQPQAFFFEQGQDLGSKDGAMDYVAESHARTHSSDMYSQESSLTRSVSSRAASEGDDMLTGQTEWQSLNGGSLDQRLPQGGIKQEAMANSETHLNHLYAGLSEAFSQHRLAESIAAPAAQASHSMPGRVEQHLSQTQSPFVSPHLIHQEHYQRRESESSGFSSNFNFEEFISERDQAAERAAASDYIGLNGQYADVATPRDANPFFFQQMQDQQQGYLDTPPTGFAASTSSSVTSHHSQAYHSDSQLLRPSSAHFSSASSVAASSPRMIDLSLRGDGEHYAPSPASSQGSWTSGHPQRSPGLMRSQSLRAYTQSSQVSHPSAYNASMQVVSPSSAHFGPTTAFDLSPIALHRPIVHPSLRRLARPVGPVRSSSTSDLHENLSCNPQYITPPYVASGSGHYDVHSTASSPGSFPLGTQSLFGFYDNLDSPSSSTVSSPQQWHSTLASDDGQSSCGGTVAEEEETYRQPQYTSVASSSASPVQLSGSLPTRPSMLRHSSWAPAMNISSSSSSSSPSLAGQPMRSTRSSAGGSAAASSPYSLSPAFNYASPLPAHLAQRLADPYSGVITKRSRGRRVPSTPEEMTNVGKSGKVYTCKVPRCGKLFKRSEHLKRHIRSIHTDEKPFTCKLCCKKFSRHDNLNQHMRVHGESGLAAGDDDEDEEDEEEEGQGSGSASGSPSSYAAETRRTTNFRRSTARGKSSRRRGSCEEDVFSFEDDERKSF